MRQAGAEVDRKGQRAGGRGTEEQAAKPPNTMPGSSRGTIIGQYRASFAIQCCLMCRDII